MACGCRKNSSNPPAPKANASGDLSKFAYLTPRQLKIKEQEVKKSSDEGDK